MKLFLKRMIQVWREAYYRVEEDQTSRNLIQVSTSFGLGGHANPQLAMGYEAFSNLTLEYLILKNCLRAHHFDLVRLPFQ